MKKHVSLALTMLQQHMSLEEVIDFGVSIGLQYMDLSLTAQSVNNPETLYGRMDMDGVAEYYTRIREHADKRGMQFAQIHGRIKGYKYDEAHNQNELAGMERDLMIGRILGAPYCVVHGVHLGLDAPDEDQRRYNHRMFCEYLPLAKKYGVPLADETLGDTHAPDGRDGVDFFGDLNEFTAAHEKLWAIDDYKNWLFVCMDTGHTNKVYRFPNKLTPAEFIRKTGGVIKCLHLNDNDTLTDQHKVPLSGCINWKDVLAALDEIGYNGIYNMELNLTTFGKSKEMMMAYADFSVKVMKELLK